MSNWFVDEISSLFPPLDSVPHSEDLALRRTAQKRNNAMLNYVNKLMNAYEIREINHIKPGIAEATRVMLRRIPRFLLVRDIENTNISHLLVLAQEKDVEVIEDTSMPFNAAAVIANVK